MASESLQEEDSLRSDLTGRVVRTGTAAAFAALFAQALAFVSFVVLAHLAPPATFGEFAAASLLLGISGLFMEAGMHAAVIQRKDHLQAAASTAFIANIVGGLSLAVAAAAAAPLIGLFFHSQTTGLAAAVLAGTILVHAASIVPSALVRRRVSIRLAFVDPLAVTAYGATAATMLAAGFEVWALVTATYAGAAVRTAVIWKLSRWRPTFALASWDMWKSLSRYGRPVLIGLLLREIGFAGTTAFVGRAFGTTVLGQFRYAHRLVMQASSSITLASAYVLLPAFARIADDKVRFRAALLRALRILTLIVFPLSILFIPLGRPIAETLLGEEWSGAGPIMMALAGVGVALSLSSVSAEAFKATARTDLLPRLHALTATVPLAFMFVLFPAGAVGMGLAMSLGLLIEATYAVRALGRISQIPLSTIFQQIRSPLIASLIMMTTLFTLDRYAIHASANSGVEGLGRLGLDLVAAVLIYVVALTLLSRQSLMEFKEVARHLARRPRRSAPTTGAHEAAE